MHVHDQRPRGSWRTWTAVALIGIVAAACGSSSSAAPGSASPSPVAVGSPTPSASPSSAPSASPSATPKGPASAKVDLTGDASLTATVVANRIVCGQPSLDGPQIEVLGKAGSTGPDIVMFIRAGHIEVRAATGSAALLRLRSFEGSGVTAFDAASGVQIDSPLTETTAAGSQIGDIGVVKSISGSIDCGDEQQGTSNVAVTGQSTQGPLDGALTGVKVTCTITASSGTFVGLMGLATSGTTPLLLFVTAGSDTLQVAVETKTGASFYTAKGAGIVTLTSGGAHVDGDVTESVKAGVTPHTLHVAGDATCGTTIHQ